MHPLRPSGDNFTDTSWRQNRVRTNPATRPLDGQQLVKDPRFTPHQSAARFSGFLLRFVLRLLLNLKNWSASMSDPLLKLQKNIRNVIVGLTLLIQWKEHQHTKTLNIEICYLRDLRSKVCAARSRLSRIRLSQPNTRWKALDKIYEIYILSHLSNRNLLFHIRQI